VSDPTWENHLALFQGAGLDVHTYPYFDAATGGVRFDAMLQAIEGISSGNVVLLHASCHNPTGADLTKDQWRELIAAMARRGLLPFVDMAYQGFGDGVDEDAWCIRAMADAGLEFMVANSFSKNFSLYGERVGGLSVVCSDAGVADRVFGQLKACVRRNYSSPPAHGARIVSQVLSNPTLLALWRDELGVMRERMLGMRAALHGALASISGAARPFDYLLRQRGMFSYTGLSAPQVRRLRDEYAVYLVESGRLCISGLTTANVERVANAMAAVVEASA
jgi:aromatic-amino-acid transaminase